MVLLLLLSILLIYLCNLHNKYDYSSLFYLAFVRFNIILLKQGLASIFMFDEFRRIIAETVLPLI